MSITYRNCIWVNRLVCGNGPASVRVLQSFSPPKFRCRDVDFQLLRVGDYFAKSHSWSRTFSNLLMGQSPGMLLKNDSVAGAFTRVSDFNAREAKSASKALADNAGFDLSARIVKVVKMGDNEILVRVRLPNNEILDIIANEVIFAQGAGLERQVDAPKSLRYSLQERPFGEYSTGSKSLTGVTQMITGAEVLIIGDGPTALWNAEHYLRNGNEVFVLGPDSDTAFKNANPGGRNSEILNILKNEGRLLTGRIEGIEERNQIREFSEPSESGILVYLKNQATLGHGRRASAVLPTSRLVSAIGSANQTLQQFDPAIVASLYTVLEKGRGGIVAIGLATPNHDIVICGAQAVCEGYLRGEGTLFDMAGSRIGQPTPGILTVEANVRSLARIKKVIEFGADQSDLLAMQDLLYRPDLDPYSANLLEFTMYFQSFDVREADALQMAMAVIETRGALLKQGGAFDNFTMAKTANALLHGRHSKVPALTE